MTMVGIVRIQVSSCVCLGTGRPDGYASRVDPLFVRPLKLNTRQQVQGHVSPVCQHLLVVFCMSLIRRAQTDTGMVDTSNYRVVGFYVYCISVRKNVISSGEPVNKLLSTRMKSGIQEIGQNDYLVGERQTHSGKTIYALNDCARVEFRVVIPRRSSGVHILSLHSIIF